MGIDVIIKLFTEQKMFLDMNIINFMDWLKAKNNIKIKNVMIRFDFLG